MAHINEKGFRGDKAPEVVKMEFAFSGLNFNQFKML